MRKKLLVFFISLLVVVGLVFMLRAPLLRGCATFLIHQDSLQHADALFVLSGGGYDRGNEAAKVFHKGFAPKIICTGGNQASEFLVFGIDTLESYATVANLKQHLISDSAIVVLPEGTSTKEEAELILRYSQERKFKRVIVLSSLLHTGRVKSIFDKKFEGSGIAMYIHGAPSSRYDELNWWKEENGLIAVNNEWVKTIYYWIKY